MSNCIKNVFILALIFTANLLFSQNSYSYISDKRFLAPNDLLGYTFRPNEIIFSSDDEPSRIKQGEVVISVLSGYLTIEQYGVKTTYNVNSINAKKFNKTLRGFELNLLNARDPGKQGVLRIILNDNDEADALILKKDSNSDQIVFYQASISDRTLVRELRYFTHTTDVSLSQLYYLFGKTVKPFMELANKQKRLTAADSLSFEFIEEKSDKKVNRFVKFRFQDRSDPEEPEMIEQIFEVKTIKEVEIGSKKDPKYALRFAVKGLEGGILMLNMDRRKNLTSIDMPGVRFVLRDLKPEWTDKVKPHEKN